VLPFGDLIFSCRHKEILTERSESAMSSSNLVSHKSATWSERELRPHTALNS
jgi:hypothetical protein